jgi:uncharacterized membrane protein
MHVVFGIITFWCRRTIIIIIIITMSVASYQRSMYLFVASPVAITPTTQVGKATMSNTDTNSPTHHLTTSTTSQTFPSLSYPPFQCRTRTCPFYPSA